MIPVGLMAEYECHPVWLGPPAEVENVTVESLGGSQDLASSVNVWAQAYELTYQPDDPVSSGFTDVRAEHDFAEVGAALARRLQRELGRRFEVTYFNVLSSADEPAEQ